MSLMYSSIAASRGYLPLGSVQTDMHDDAFCLCDLYLHRDDLMYATFMLGVIPVGINSFKL